nr:hypothetical protein BCACJCBH_00143 [White spot syndrome virus]
MVCQYNKSTDHALDLGSVLVISVEIAISYSLFPVTGKDDKMKTCDEICVFSISYIKFGQITYFLASTLIFMQDFLE